MLDIPEQRDPQRLLQALQVALAELDSGAGQREALRDSFQHARAGLRARTALLLYVPDPKQPSLEILHSSGLSPQQMRACQDLQSSEGISPTIIREAISSGETQWIPNSQMMQLRETPQRTASLATGSHSVLCAPIRDPHTGVVLAVVYFENKGLASAFDEQDRDWLKAYAAGIGHAFALHLSRERRIQELEAEERRRRNVGDGPELVGDSEATRRLLTLLDGPIAQSVDTTTPPPILILGERGTGKDIVARYIHYYSQKRSARPFISYNCSALRATEISESKLFGHLKGSFTGADRDNPGLFREAHRGVLFLDEIGELPHEAQALLLRVIESKEVQPVGSARALPIDVLLVLATNVDLRAAIERGSFRADLFDRINAINIQIKPLGSVERRSDIRPLLTHFLAKQQLQLKKKAGSLTFDAVRALLAYSWPGNAREISNVCTKLVLYALPGAKIDMADLRTHCPEVLDGPRHPDAQSFYDDTTTVSEAKRLWEREFLRQRLERFNGNVSAAADSLGISRSRLKKILRREGQADDDADDGEEADQPDE